MLGVLGCRCTGQPKYLSGRSDTRPDAKYLSGQSDTRPDTHWSVFSFIPAVSEQTMDLGKTRGLFDGQIEELVSCTWQVGAVHDNGQTDESSQRGGPDG